MSTLESTILGAAEVSVSCSQFATLMELWILTGCDPRQRPDDGFFREAIWDAALLAYEEGRRVHALPDHSFWDDEIAGSRETCGVDVFH